MVEHVMSFDSDSCDTGRGEDEARTLLSKYSIETARRIKLSGEVPMAPVNGALSMNTAFLREIKGDNQHLQELLAELREVTGIPVVERNHRHRIVELLVELRDQLAFHFALEEAYGYFEDAIDVAPRVSERADELRQEHAILFEAIRNIAENAEEWHTQQSSHYATHGEVHGNSAWRTHLFHRIVSRFHHFSHQLLQHEQNEKSLMLDALDTDIGGEG